MPFSGYPLPENFTNATPATDVHPAAHNNVNAAVNDVQDQVTAVGLAVRSGTGSPEGVVTAPISTLYRRTDGGTNSSVYRKESGAGNTGWVAVTNGGVGGDATTVGGATPAQLRDRTTHTGNMSADNVTDGSTNKAFTGTEKTKLAGIAINAGVSQLASTISDFNAAVGAAIPVAPSTEVAYAQITANQAFTVDALNIDLVSGLAVTIPSLSVPVYVHALITATHSVSSAVVNAVLCKTVPTPATILDSLGMGFACCTTAGKQANCAVMCRIPPATPCTVQLYVAGDGGTLTVLGQTYAPSKIWAVTV